MLRDSILYADSHEDDAVDYAMAFGRGINPATGKRFIRMYVNEDTRNMGEEGLTALRVLFDRAQQQGLIGAAPPLDVVGLQ
jgi:1,4-dihydroxy-6-naphthoate synthase